MNCPGRQSGGEALNIDIEVIKKAKTGDRDAFCALYETISSDLYRMALYTLGNVQDAEDAVSETFVEAYKGLRLLRDEGAFRPWMFRILSARCKRKIKGYIKGRQTSDIDEMLDLAAPGDATTDSINRADILDAMGTLSEEERQIVLLSVVEGYTGEEIAKILRMPRGTISSKLSRALKKLRVKLSV